MKHLNILGAGLLLSLLATTAPAYAQNQGYWRQDEPTQKEQAAADNQVQDQNDRNDWNDRNRGNDPKKSNTQDNRNHDNAQRQNDRNDQRQATRLSNQQRDQSIRDERQRQADYAQNLAQQQQRARQAAGQLQQQNRQEEYRQHQDYLERLAEQQRNLRHRRDYRSDPFYYTASNYRYYRGGRSYETNQYGADVLRQAVNNGYAEGYRSGTASRMDRWRGNYTDVFAYQDANYGYGGQYISQSEYNYYFRQGFQRGYGDGYGNHRRYGDDNNSVLADVLVTILNLQSFR